MNLEAYIEFCAAENALKFNGTANPKAVFGKVVAKFPESKADMVKLQALIAEITTATNAKGLDVQKKIVEASGIAPVEKNLKKELKELEGAKAGNVIMRFAPSASGPYMHIGHAITGGLTSAYIKKYGGKFIFRLEDTDSDKTDPLAYKNMLEDANWIFGNVHEYVIQSDRMELYYKHAKQFIEMGHMYACSCTSEEFKKLADAQTDCPCRHLSPTQNLDRYNSMFDTSQTTEGAFVLRWKSSMQHPNPAMRDFPLMRINDTNHPRQGTKYRVWPLMNFSVFVDDVEMGMTHIIRAKDHADNAKKQELLYRAMGKTPPVCYFTGRYNIEGLEISKTRTKELIANGELTGWDDIRIAFLRPLSRRGYQAAAFINYSMDVGITAVDKTITAADFFAKLDACNKDIIDPIASRYYFVQNDVQLKTAGIISQVLTLDSHPDRKGKGGRIFNFNDSVFVDQSDLSDAKEGMMIRLMDFCNVVLEDGVWKYHSKAYEDFKTFAAPKKIIHWVVKDTVPVEVLMPDATKCTGNGESSLAQAKVGDVIQFERFGFCRLDSIENGTYKFWFGHK